LEWEAERRAPQNNLSAWPGGHIVRKVAFGQFGTGRFPGERLMAYTNPRVRDRR